MSIFAALFLLLGASGTDQGSDAARTGSRVDPAQRALTNADTVKANEALYRMLECAASRRESRVRMILDARSEESYQQAAGALDDVQRCSMDAYTDESASYISFMTARGTSRGMLAEIFLKRAAARSAALPALPAQKTYSRDWYALTGRDKAIDEMSTCVADINPGGILALLRTDWSSKEQKAAVAALAPSLGTCLVKGVQLNTNALGLRTSLAEALYHRAFDNSPVPGAN